MSAEFSEDKTVLVTGGSGSVGRSLIREILKHAPRVVRVLDHDENGLWSLQDAFQGESALRYLVGDVRDASRVRRAAENVDLIFHLAALKHVPSCEYNPFEAVQTNVLGTQNVIDAALACDAEKVILTSTDKAANPSNVMGTTKLLAEKLIVAANYYRGKRRTTFAAVRFGNLVGSRGSVHQLFRDQVARGGPVTITDPEMTRFVMRSTDAVRLLLRAAELARGGETFILKMDAVRLSDVLEVTLSSGGERKSIDVRKVGARPGEKTYEELLTEEEVTRAYELRDMYVLLPNMPELLRPDPRAYPGAKPAKHIPYRSDRVEKLTLKQVGDLLSAEGLS